MLRHLFSAAFLVMSVTAASAEMPRQMQVSLSDLNLNRPAGQATAQARIQAAAIRLCGSARYTADLQGWASSGSDRACVARAIERANAQLARAQ